MTIPVFDERLSSAGRADGPDIIARVGGYCVQPDLARIRASDDLLPGSVPMLGQRMKHLGLRVKEVSHGPDVVRGNGGHTVQAAIC